MYKLLKEKLLKVGILVNDMNDFINTRDSYPEAIPILVDFLLHSNNHICHKEVFVRALTVKEAKAKIKVVEDKV